MQLSLKNFNMYTIISLIILIGGIVFYIIWGTAYKDAWTDIGIYSITSVLILGGLIGFILSLSLENKEE